MGIYYPKFYRLIFGCLILNLIKFFIFLLQGQFKRVSHYSALDFYFLVHTFRETCPNINKK